MTSSAALLPGDEPAPAGRRELETAVLRDAWRIVRRHRLLFAVLLLLPLGASIAVAVLTRSTFTASSSVVVDLAGQNVITVRNVLSDVPADTEAMVGEIELLASRELLEQVATRLSLLDDPEFNPALSPAPWRRLLNDGRTAVTMWLGGEPPPEAAARPMNDVVDTLRAGLVIAPVGRSRVIRITATARDGAVAAQIANTLAAVYTEEHLRLRTQARQQANGWIVERLNDLRQRADRSARLADTYRAAGGLQRGRDSLLVSQQATEASTQATVAHARAAEARAKLSEADGALKATQPDQMASVLSSPLVQQLRQQEAKLTANRADLFTTLGSSHPRALAAQSQLADLQAQIAAETRRIFASLRDDLRAAEAVEADAVKRLAESRQGVEAASAQDLNAQDLQRVADADAAIYQTFLTRARETEAQVAFPTVNVRVLSTAVPPNRPVSPNRGRIVLAGAVLGTVLAFVGALVRDLWSRGLRTSAEIEQLVGVPAFGSIPYRARRANLVDKLRHGEAVAALWTRLFLGGGEGTKTGDLRTGDVKFGNGRAAPKSVVITSALPGEGKTVLARSLALVAAEHGQRVLIIDADLRRSSLTGSLHAHDGARLGLYDLLGKRAVLADVVVAEEHLVDVLPAGRGGDNPVKLLSSPQLGALLRTAGQSYDLIIIDSPPVLIGADSWWLCRSADMTLLAVRWGRTPRHTVRATLAQLLQVGVRNVEIVLSIVDAHRSGLYDGDTMLAVTSRSAVQSSYLVRQ